MSQLIEKKCQACEGGIPVLTKSECENLLKETPGWDLSKDSKYIYKSFSFKGFYAVMGFINAVAYIVQKEGHHPDIELGYNYCRLKFTTHAIDGLSENDFICAAKVNALL
jgi:4a-hydroxytetrahydrobiopterin dehydratase